MRKNKIETNICWLVETCWLRSKEKDIVEVLVKAIIVEIIPETVNKPKLCDIIALGET